MDTKIVNLDALRKVKQAERGETSYRIKILAMDKTELLNEMIRFQEERSLKGQLTPELMIKGRVLFHQLEKSAETDALKILSGSYRRHLEFELKDFIQTGQIQKAD